MNAPQPVDEATKALVEEKMNTAKEKKAAADESFKKGDFKPGARCSNLTPLCQINEHYLTPHIALRLYYEV
jgi:hypothetical protein